MRQSKIVVITGGIGSGKSAVCRILAEKFPVLSADEISREVIGRADVREEISKQLTADFYDEQGVLDRKALGKWVFADEKRTETLNRIMHGAIYRELLTRSQALAAKGEELIFCEIPLYFEAGADFPCDGVWVVTADRELRIERAKLRDGISEAEIEDRIRRQIPTETLKTAHTVIENNGTAESLRRNVERALERFGRK